MKQDGWKCLTCHEQGHFARECKKPKCSAHGSAGEYRGPKRRHSNCERGREKPRKLEAEQRVITIPSSNSGAHHGLFVDGAVRGTKCRFLIDTGSTDTLISSIVYHQIPREQRPVLEINEVRNCLGRGANWSDQALRESHFHRDKMCKNFRNGFPVAHRWERAFPDEGMEIEW